jgi:xylan 1,4-beta-xylosidase
MKYSCCSMRTKTFIALTVLLSSVPILGAADSPDTSTWVQFSSFSYNGKSSASPNGDEYLNPIIAGFYPDPSICRVGDDYYLVNSSFQYFPGIPIWHSKDLVNWTQIGNVIDRTSQYPARGGDVSRGMYAPTIRYHDGTYYIVCTLVNGPGNFYVTANDPKGPWSDLIPLRGVGGIDPSLFFDEDGKCYVTNCDEPPQNRAQYNGHRTIRLQELDLEQKKVAGEQTILVNGGTDIDRHPVWCEAPHLYKINGAYYLMCAQGGTGTAHSEVIFKSETLRGPYTPGPNNPMITAVGLPNDRPNPVTCTGHADLVQTPGGEWWSVFLACQPYQNGFYNTGRQTFLLPVSWENGWPTILPPHTPVPLTVKRPNLSAEKPAAVATSGNIEFIDNFDSDSLASRWVSLRAPTSQWYAVSKAIKGLRLQPRADQISGQGNPSFLAVRQQNNDFNCSVTLAAGHTTVDCVAGLAAFQNERHYYAINVKIDAGHLSEVSLEQPTGGRGPGRGANAAASGQSTPQKLPDNLTSIELRIEGAGPVTRCLYKAGVGEFTQLGEDLPSSFLSTDTAGGFQGVTLGLFAHD